MENRQLFLLGGYDLEMLTICKVLNERGLMVKDNALQWNNAYLSKYQDELEQYGNAPSWTIYGIELKEDIIVPSNYIRIDHHNDYSHKPSSLEQIMSILHIPLNRFQQLVATNDSAYIPGLQKIGATSYEIEKIRYEDRKAQGVTIEEEKQAEEAIKDKETYGDLIIVHAHSSRFSPICDRLYPYKRLLIYTDQELVYYGKDVDKLVTLYHVYIKEKRIFYGGGVNGFLGTVKGAFTKEELKHIIQQIKLHYR